jgi:SAM-dependent methyltransferase
MSKVRTQNKIQDILQEFNIIDPSAVTELYPRVRDTDGVKVMKCTRSGVIFLSTDDHISREYYSDKSGTSYWSATSRKEALKETWEDDHRRFEQFHTLVTRKSYLDIGTGLGGILDLMKDVASEVHGVELQAEVRDYLNKEAGLKVYDGLESIPSGKIFDVVTLFHVFEHLSDPVGMLKQVREKMNVGGKLVIEVPHANDFLIRFLDLESFKSFTFWSEHLILHTRTSLEIMLRAAGFANVTVSGYQRYPLANHMHWLAKNKPGGHVVWPQLRSEDLDNAYSDVLKGLDMTDTIIAIAER